MFFVKAVPTTLSGKNYNDLGFSLLVLSDILKIGSETELIVCKSVKK